MKLNLLKLGSKAKDVATGLSGMVILIEVGMDKRPYYRFQPKGLDEAGQPITSTWVVEDRLKGDEREREDVDVPVNVLGSQVEDTATGFKGTAIGLFLHMSGCVHVLIQPAGKVKKTGAPIAPVNFDILRLKGNEVAVLTKAEVKQSHQEKPSPTEHASTSHT